MKRRFRVLSVLATTTLVLACLDCGSGGTNDPSNASASTGDAAAGAVLPPGALDIVLNEWNVVGTVEWLEIGNKGAAAFDLSGYALADSDKTTGKPKSDDAMSFPPGTTVPAGGKILILASKKDLPVGPHPKGECLAEGPDTCLYAHWGVSAASGEQVHLLASGGAVVSSAAYPRNLGIDSANGQTACRLPDLTGEFATCKSTPGGTNAAP